MQGGPGSGQWQSPHQAASRCNAECFACLVSFECSQVSDGVVGTNSPMCHIQNWSPREVSEASAHSHRHWDSSPVSLQGHHPLSTAAQSEALAKEVSLHSWTPSTRVQVVLCRGETGCQPWLPCRDPIVLPCRPMQAAPSASLVMRAPDGSFNGAGSTDTRASMSLVEHLCWGLGYPRPVPWSCSVSGPLPPLELDLEGG